MSPQQADLIKRLVRAERYYRNEREAKGGMPQREQRWVEVGRISGVSRRTAESLVDAGLCEMMQGWNETQTVVWLKDDLG